MKDQDPDSRPVPLTNRRSGSRTSAGGKENSRKENGAREKASSKRESKAQRKARAEQKRAFEAQREEKIRVLWDEFNTLFPTDSDCLRALCFGYDFTEGVVRCFYCNNQQAEMDFLGRNTVCMNCGQDIWYTADGPFRGNKKPRAWLAHIWLMGKGMLVCSSAFHRLVGVAQSTAADIFKAVTHRVLHVMDSADLDSVMLASARFIETFIRRSDQTPRLAHPSEEQLACEHDFGASSADSQDECQSDFEDGASSSSSSSSSSRDGDATADGGFADDASVYGASIGHSTRFERPSMETEIDLFHRFIQLIYQGISRKYLCHYLAGYWIQISERWRGDSLLRLMQAKGPVLRDEIQASVVPLLVRFPCLETAERKCS